MESSPVDNKIETHTDLACPVEPANPIIESLPLDTYLHSPKVELTYYQRKMKQYEEECLKSFGGNLGNIEVKPKLSKIQQEKKILHSSETQNVVVCRKRKLIEEHQALFNGSLDEVFKKISPKSNFSLMHSNFILNSFRVLNYKH